MNGKKGKAPKGYKQVERGDIIGFEKAGDKAEGNLTSVQAGVGRHDSNLYHYADKDTKEMKSFFGSTVIDDLFKAVKIGQNFLLVFAGKVKTSAGFKVKNFNLFIKKK